MRTKKYTVVSLCKCGCDQAEVWHVVAPTEIKAAEMAQAHAGGLASQSVNHNARKHAGRNLSIMAVFAGHHHDLYE